MRTFTITFILACWLLRCAVGQACLDEAQKEFTQVFPAAPQNESIATVSELGLLFRSITSFPGMPKRCVDAVVRFFCLYAFRECVCIQRQDFTQTHARKRCLLHLAVKSAQIYTRRCLFTFTETDCYEHLNTFADFVILTEDPDFDKSRLLFNCNATESGDPADNSSPFIAGLRRQPLFPEDYQRWNLSTPHGPTIVPVSCNFKQQQSLAGVFPCYGPWGPDNDTEDQPYCRYICEYAFLYDPAVCERAATEGYVIGWIGVVLCTLAVISRFAVPKFRKYPANLTTFMMIAAQVCNVAFLMPSLVGFTRFMCEGKYWTLDDYYELHLGYTDSGIAQGLLIYWAVLCMPLYWCAVAVHSFLALRLKRSTIFSRKTEIATHVIWYSSGIPTIGLIIAATYLDGNAVRTYGVIPMYFPNDSPENVLDHTYYPGFHIDDGVFWIPLYVIMTVGILCTLGVLWELRVLRASGSKKEKYKAHLRVLLFLFSMLFLFSCAVGYKGAFTQRLNTWIDHQLEWTRLSIFADQGPYRTGEWGPRESEVYFITFVFSFQPLMMALIFGTTLEQLYWWKRFIYKVFFNKEIDIESKLASDDGRSSTPTPGSGSKQISNLGSSLASANEY